MKRIAILGSTGSIGTSSLRVVAQYPDHFRIVGLTAGRNVSLLVEQIHAFDPSVVAVSDGTAFRQLFQALSGKGRPQVLQQSEGICAVASLVDADVIISAIVGSAGLLPTLAAVRARKTVALANKETLVMAGGLVMAETARYGANLIPVDSEHSAIFQCMNGRSKDDIRRIILTASGGPFRGKSRRQLQSVTPEEALRHPNWSMGRKVTIDSATLMNKGLEVIEAHYLFDLPPDKIDVLVHPQSIVHSIVEFNDGSYLAQLSQPDMKGPIAFALSWPDRLGEILEPLNWERLRGLTFRRPDHRAFPCLSLAYAALDAGGTMTAVLNAANELAVEAFLVGRVGFTALPVIIEKVMNAHAAVSADELEVILEADRWARERALSELRRL